MVILLFRLTDVIPKNQNFKLSFDNWFSFYYLMLTLKYMGVLAIGTVRTNRMMGCEFKNDKIMKREGRGTFDCKIDSTYGIIGCKWFDNKFVHLFSNYMGPEPTDIV